MRGVSAGGVCQQEGCVSKRGVSGGCVRRVA